MPDDDLDFKSIINGNNAQIDFSFVLPTAADNVFYVDCATIRTTNK